jgi:replicative DNA helicase
MTLASFERVHTAAAVRAAPQNVELEQALLGAILINNDAFGRVSDFLEPDHFFEPIHQKVYQIVGDLIRGGKTATPITLKTFLPAEFDVAGITVGQYLARLAAEATTVLNAEDYGRSIYDLCARRRIIVIAEETAVAAYEASVELNPRGLASGAIEALDEIASPGKNSHIARVSVGEAAEDAVSQMSFAMQNPGVMGGISYGLRDIDRKTDGLHKSELIILAGRPGMLKTGTALAIALRRAVARCPVLFFSLEMGAPSLAHRAMADLCFERGERIPYSNLAAGRVTDAEAQNVIEAARFLRTVPLTIEQQPALTVSQITTRARKAQQRLDRLKQSLGLVVVDHMHIMRPSERYKGNRVSELTEISGGLKALAMELGVPVLALAQLSRAVEARDEKRPQLSDLRDSGSLEQDADTVILLYREEYYLERGKFDDPDKEDKRVARLFDVRNRLELNIAKQRNGPVGTETIFFDAACNHARDLARSA